MGIIYIISTLLVKKIRQGSYKWFCYPYSKTKSYRIKTIIQFIPLISPLCPIKSLIKLFYLHPKGEDDSLFSRSIGGPFNRQFFVKKIKELLLQVGISIFKFSEYSINDIQVCMTVYYTSCRSNQTRTFRLFYRIFL